MRSDRMRRAEEVLDTILKELNEDRMCERVNKPIDAVLQDFTGRLGKSGENRATAAVFSEFVRRVYVDGLKAGLGLFDSDATSLALLEDHYQGLRSDGYFAAVLDATTSEMGGGDSGFLFLMALLRPYEVSVLNL